MIEFIDGNTAVVRAALDAGCDFFAGYPITPSTSILHDLVRELPPRGGVVVQAEDEIASIGMCLAASVAGRRAMTATSGPGTSLMSETIGLAIMGEAPLVIVAVQRMGPATGGATTSADGDVQFVRGPGTGVAWSGAVVTRATSRLALGGDVLSRTVPARAWTLRRAVP